MFVVNLLKFFKLRFMKVNFIYIVSKSIAILRDLFAYTSNIA